MADIGGVRRRAGRRGLWIVAGIAAAGAVLAVLGIWHLPDRMYPPGTDGGAEARAALQGGLLTAAAALMAVAGGLIALDETRQANAETKRANEAADVRERAANLNTHVRELYVEAAKLLNDPDNLGVRLAGIYALERIARDSAEDQRTVAEVLSAFVREHTRSPAPTPPARRPPPGRRWTRPLPDTDGGALAWLATDVQAALTVLGRLPTRPDVPRADLNGADLTRAQLGGADLTGAQLGAATLTSAMLDGADLTGARLVGADLTDAWLVGADLTDARLSRATLTDAWLDGADLTRARLGRADLTRAQLDGADLTDAQLDGADLSGVGGLTAEQVARARGDVGTRLPDDVARPESWPPYDPSADPSGAGS